MPRPASRVRPGAGTRCSPSTDSIAEGRIAQIREASEQVKAIFEVRWEFHTCRGDPCTGLVRAADDLRADVVVVGASERAGHRIIGSVAIRLGKSGRRPVTVVPWPRRRPDPVGPSSASSPVPARAPAQEHVADGVAHGAHAGARRERLVQVTTRRTSRVKHVRMRNLPF